ncbi:Utp18p NDAI_0G05710 [Naumovozyma dairenensis CBS 421]|uniref:Anaphase-promoting complex subunit 4 WD40 domain-containing protein n=1 Tax=Naumovozyma dairenensis (strain ATCC 10597 / BCRC 20456 / CBS 421 / NBRC 0211 / NRRL Y-12639) TaxID=1071378 RepID=J7REL2_NAUDC|nr:hypothetical protein NDAI_0G05710 [Naumovozyma dairenensis CBS 421]CCK73554.1 hypothetical protein NDAI_0G05710 [Naumovozyma dairenensis CBS 421]
MSTTTTTTTPMMKRNNPDYEIPPPDQEEELLAKLVFGDTSDFQSSLANFNLDFLNEDDVAIFNGDEETGNGSDDDQNEAGEEQENMDHVNDDQLFFVDEGHSSNNEDDDAMDIDEESDFESSEEEDSDSDFEDGNAWVDSDDENLNISIMTTNKTKKLRTSYQETSINGKNYVRRLRAQFEKIYPRPKWVDDISDEEDNADSSEEENNDIEEAIDGDVHALSKILQTTYNYKDTSISKLLPPKTLDILRLKDANISHPSHSAIQSLSFHPTKPLLLTGGYDKTLRIYHIDGKHNHLVTSLHLKGTPIQTCTFYMTPSHSEQKIFTGGRRRYMHSWDLSSSSSASSSSSSMMMAKVEKFSRLYGHEETQRSFEKFKLGHYYNFSTKETHGIILLQGNNGWINITHATTGLWLTGCKIEGILVDFCIDYKPLSGNKFQTILIATNTYGEVWEFILNKNGEILRRWKDEGGVGITTIQVGGGTNSNNFFSTTKNGNNNKIQSNKWLAIGSESGFVNIYDRKKNNTITTPVASLDQLTTSISSLTFSPDGQMLCMASRAVKDALRLIHLPSCTVFANWPTSGTPLGKVTSVTFSPSGEMLAVGNEQGKVRLWRLNHY